MIKPESLWSLCKSCPDSKWIGDIMRALGGQEVVLDFGQKQMYVAVQNDSQWMDERIEERRERQRKNMKEYRNRKSQESQPHCDRRDNHNRLQTSVTSLPTSLPPSLPTCLPRV